MGFVDPIDIPIVGAYCARTLQLFKCFKFIDNSTANYSCDLLRPMKKKSGVIAGIARNGGGRDSPVGSGQYDENGDVRPRIRNSHTQFCLRLYTLIFQPRHFPFSIFPFSPHVISRPSSFTITITISNPLPLLSLLSTPSALVMTVG